MTGQTATGFAAVRAFARCFVLAGALAGCAVFEKAEPAPGPCTRALILADAETATWFRDGPGRDLLDVSYSGRVARVHSDCEYKMEKDKTGVMRARVHVGIEATRGPANRDRAAQFDYFVTLAALDHEPISKNVFSIGTTFPGNVTQMILTDDSVELRTPIKAGQSGRSFVILVGFQLTPDQLEYNRRIRRERESAR